MTDRQKKHIVRVLKASYEEALKDHPDNVDLHKHVTCLMMDLADAINLTSTTFERGKFLKDCGHPDYQPKEKKGEP